MPVVPPTASPNACLDILLCSKVALVDGFFSSIWESPFMLRNNNRSNIEIRCDFSHIKFFYNGLFSTKLINVINYYEIWTIKKLTKINSQYKEGYLIGSTSFIIS